MLPTLHEGHKDQNTKTRQHDNSTRPPAVTTTDEKSVAWSALAVALDDRVVNSVANLPTTGSGLALALRQVALARAASEEHA
jgi:hypothetical protein